MAPHAEHDVLVVLLLLLVALLAPLVLLVLPAVLLPLVVAWFPRIRALIFFKKIIKILVKVRNHLDVTGFRVSEIFFSLPSLLAAVLALKKEVNK